MTSRSWTYLEDDELELGDVVGMHPVLGRLANKILLATTSRRVALGRTSSRPDIVVDLGELDDESVVVVLEKGLCVQPCSKKRLKLLVGMRLVVLLDNLLETGVVQLYEFGEIMYVGNDIRQVLLEQIELLLGWRILLGLVVLRVLCEIMAGNDFLDLLLTVANAADDLLALDFLKGENLV